MCRNLSSPPFISRLLLVRKLFDDGNSLLRGERFEEASFRFEYALKKMPSGSRPEGESARRLFDQMRSRLLLDLSTAQRKQGQYSAAILRASEVIENNSAADVNSVQLCRDALWNRSKARLDSGDTEGAQDDVREAIKLAPRDIHLHKLASEIRTIKGGGCTTQEDNQRSKETSNSNQTLV